MSITYEGIEEMYRLESVTRYNNHAKVRSESVATHSYFVGLMTMMLCDELEVPKHVTLAAMRFALVHDLPEIYTGDITYDAKQLMPALDDELGKVENSYFEKYFPEIHKMMYKADPYDMIAIEVVKLADILSVYQYSAQEGKLGNAMMGEKSDWMHSIYRRIHTQKQKLEGMGVSCQKIKI